MNKLSRRLALRISIIILIIFGLSFAFNNYFLATYYLHELKVILTKAFDEIDQITYQELEKLTEQELVELIERVENKYNVTIVHGLFNDPDNLDQDPYLSEFIKSKFYRKKIALHKFYITEDMFNIISQGKRVTQIFNQGKLKSSFLVTLFKKGKAIIAVGLSVTHDSDTIKIINQSSLYLNGLSILVVVIFVWIFSKRIIYPLEKLKDLAKNISNLNFTKINIKTGDEIEELANSINLMSEKLKKAHHDLAEKNENLKTFIANITHELKTPLALTKAYAVGMKDGLDDDTYQDIILKQVDEMSRLVDYLLELSKLEKETITKQVFDFQELFFTVLEKYQLYIKNEKIELTISNSGLTNPKLFADREKIEIVLKNLLHNAVKYTANQQIAITIKNDDSKVMFAVKNGINEVQKKDLEKIWEPFYVLEYSRDKKLSGTGLGLSIVKTILDKHGLKYGVHLLEDQIEFYIFLLNPE